MDGTASGKEPLAVNATAALLTLLLALAAGSPAAGQTPGSAAFRVFQRGVPIGTVDVSVTREDGGWRVQSTGRTAGSVNLALGRFDASYDSRWYGRFMSMETAPLAARDPRAATTIVHVAMTGRTTRTDTVTAKEARWRSHSVSPDTVFLPPHVYGAFEAVAARLHAAGQRAEMPLLMPPDGEQRGIVDAWEQMQVPMRTGPPLTASRHTLTLIGPVPTSFQVWEAQGRLVRVELPRDGISVVRADVLTP